MEAGAKLLDDGAKTDGNTDGKAATDGDGEAHTNPSLNSNQKQPNQSANANANAEPAKQLTQAEVEAIELKSGARGSDASGHAGGEEAPEKVSRKREQSVLQAKLTRLTIQIGQMGTIIALLTVLVLIINFAIKTYVLKHEGWSAYHLQFFIKFFIIGARVPLLSTRPVRSTVYIVQYTSELLRFCALELLSY